MSFSALAEGASIVSGNQQQHRNPKSVNSMHLRQSSRCFELLVRVCAVSSGAPLAEWGNGEGGGGGRERKRMKEGGGGLQREEEEGEGGREREEKKRDEQKSIPLNAAAIVTTTTTTTTTATNILHQPVIYEQLLEGEEI